MKAGIVNPIQLILDMKVRWSSTFRMLDRADKNQEHINTFVDELRWEETDSSKRNKIHALKLDEEEWKQVSSFTDLLMHANNAQQAFLSDHVSTLHLAIPALEALYRAWSSRANHAKYAAFTPALQATCQKINDYYEKTTNSPAYIMAMILDPREKMSYFKKHWPKDLHVKVLKCVREVRFLCFNDSEDPKKTEVPKSSAKGLKVLLHELSDEESEDDTSNMCLKCAIQHELLFREPDPSSLYEAELEKLENGENDGAIGAGEEGWDELLSDDEDEDSFDMDIDLDSD
ncbi:hypothetical protein C0995_012706 [Termitomyces sp. Mi166|nr:hypothetical protein C0995_012706 [Termitomyces sp. Mi166\